MGSLLGGAKVRALARINKHNPFRRAGADSRQLGIEPLQ